MKFGNFIKFSTWQLIRVKGLLLSSGLNKLHTYSHQYHKYELAISTLDYYSLVPKHRWLI